MSRLPLDRMELPRVKLWLIGWLQTAVLCLVIIFSFLSSAQAEDLTCRKGESYRRVQLKIVDISSGLPCEVVASSKPAEQRLLWRAEFERGFCAKKLHELIRSLEAEQWQCRPTDFSTIGRQVAGQQPVM